MAIYPTRAGVISKFTATQERAAHKIAPRLSELLGTYVDPYDLKLYPALGYWASNHADVQRWTGSFKRPNLPKLSYSMGSWDVTLSKIASGCRFDIADNRDKARHDNDFAIYKP